GHYRHCQPSGRPIESSKVVARSEDCDPTIHCPMRFEAFKYGLSVVESTRGWRQWQRTIWEDFWLVPTTVLEIRHQNVISKYGPEWTVLPLFLGQPRPGSARHAECRASALIFTGRD